jgi:hypothetical protein
MHPRRPFRPYRLQGAVGRHECSSRRQTPIKPAFALRTQEVPGAAAGARRPQIKARLCPVARRGFSKPERHGTGPQHGGLHLTAIDWGWSIEDTAVRLTEVGVRAAERLKLADDGYQPRARSHSSRSLLASREQSPVASALTPVSVAKRDNVFYRVGNQGLKQGGKRPSGPFPLQFDPR